MIKPLTSLRFFAALWVFVFHLKIHGIVPSFGPIDAFVVNGPIGMTFFFVLSGFILTLAGGDFTAPGAVKAFYVRRIARVYPLYLFVIFVSWGLIGFASDLGRHPLASGLGHLAADLTLTTAWFPQLFAAGLIRAGTWSLSAEAFFYLLFPLAYLHLRHASLRKLAFVCCVSIGLTAYFAIISTAIGPQKLGAGFAVFYSMPIFRLGEFIAGVSGGVLIARSEARPSLALTSMVGFAAITYACLVPPQVPFVAHSLVFSPVLLLLFAYFRANGDSMPARVMSTKALVFLGESSFALYLVQCVTIPWYLALDEEAKRGIGGPIGIVTITFAASCAAHLLVEKPARRFIISRFKHTQP